MDQRHLTQLTVLLIGLCVVAAVSAFQPSLRKYNYKRGPWSGDYRKSWTVEKRQNGGHARTLQSEMEECGQHLQSIDSSCRPILAKHGLDFDHDQEGAIQAAMGMSVRQECRVSREIVRCFNDTLRGSCSQGAQLMVEVTAGKYIKAMHNALKYMCDDHIDEFEALKTCVVSSLLTDVMQTMEEADCEFNPQAAYNHAARDLCGTLPELDCPLKMIGILCGTESSGVVRGLVVSVLNDIGCEVHKRSSLTVEPARAFKAFEMLRRYIKT